VLQIPLLHADYKWHRRSRKEKVVAEFYLLRCCENLKFDMETAVLHRGGRVTLMCVCVCVCVYIYTHTIYTRPLSVQAENSRSCPFLNSLGYSGSLVTWKVVCLTAAKFKPLVLSVPGFALSNIANIYACMQYLIVPPPQMDLELPYGCSPWTVGHAQHTGYITAEVFMLYLKHFVEHRNHLRILQFSSSWTITRFAFLYLQSTSVVRKE
jgi:hypothetical protein